MKYLLNEPSPTYYESSILTTPFTDSSTTGFSEVRQSPGRITRRIIEKTEGFSGSLQPFGKIIHRAPVKTAGDFNNNDFLKKRKNLALLKSFRDLEYNWNDNGADPFDPSLIYRCIERLNLLPVQPDIFPTARDSIQYEYERDNGEYLEIEIYGTNYGYLYIDANGKSHEGETESWELIMGLFNEYHASTDCC